MSEQKIGDILDGMGVTLDLNDGDLIDSVVVLAKVVDSDGDVGLYIGDSQGLSWLDQMGLVSAAHSVVQQVPYRLKDED